MAKSAIYYISKKKSAKERKLKKQSCLLKREENTIDYYTDLRIS